MQLNNEEEFENQNPDPKILSRLDSLPFSKWHIFMALALGLVWIFDGYEVTLISLFRHEIQDEHSENLFKSLVTAYQVGCIVGSCTFGILAFIIGRRKIFLITLVIYFFGVLFSGIKTVPFLFVFSRFITGLSVGGQFTAIFTAIDEFLPPTHRGRVNIAIDGTWHLGGTIASLLTMYTGEIQNWRILFLVGWIGIISLFFLRRNVPQSPRWLMLNHRQKEAEQIVQLIEKAVHQDKSMLDSQQTNRQTFNQSRNFQNQSFLYYLKKIAVLLKQAVSLHTKKFIVSFTLIFTQAFFFNLVYYQYPETLSSTYHLDQSQISTYMLPLSLISFISTIFIGPSFDKIGRKKMLLITYATSGVLLIVTQWIEKLILLEIVICILFVFASPAASSANLIASEIFPTSSRTIVLFVMFVVSMLGGICGVWINLVYIASGLMIFAGILAFLYCPDAENKSLEEIQQIK